MAPRSTGEVVERKRAGGRVFALRFRAYGRRHFLTLGGAADGWTRPKAEAELRHILADVERGLWAPHVARQAEAPGAPTFHEFASDWLDARRPELRDSSIADYSWQLCNRLLPFFDRHRLPQITVAEVDRYRDFKVREGVLSPESINKTITRLGRSWPSPRNATRSRATRCASTLATASSRRNARDRCTSSRPIRSSP